MKFALVQIQFRQLKTLLHWNNRLFAAKVVKSLEKLKKLTRLGLADNTALANAQIAELKKALPNCFIQSNPKK